MTKEELIKQFEDTLQYSRKLNLKSKTTKWTFNDINDDINDKIDTTPKKTNNILVTNLDTISALEKYSKLGKTCILNMASAKRPGGGVEKGSNAQEESLFRRSNLWDSIDKDFYPLKIDECLYTQDSIFFKDKNYNIINPIKADVITIAAFNINEIKHFIGPKILKFEELDKIIQYQKNTKDKIKLMLSIPHKFKTKNLILGAWGCGVYKNDPEKISQYFKEILINQGFSKLYDNIIFAINDNDTKNNLEIFKKNLN